MSKDTWVIADEPQSNIDLPGSPLSEKPESDYSGALPSRAADNLFWVGRYAERAEGCIRLLRTTIKKLYNNPDRANPGYEASLFTLLRSITRLTHTYPGFIGKSERDNPESAGFSARLLHFPEPELLSIAWDENRAGSLAYALRCLFQAGYAVRDLWSADTWRVMEELERNPDLPEQPNESTLRKLQEIWISAIRPFLHSADW